MKLKNGLFGCLVACALGGEVGFGVHRLFRGETRCLWEGEKERRVVVLELFSERWWWGAGRGGESGWED